MDYALAKDPAIRPKFLDQLGNALMDVGFLYLSDPPRFAGRYRSGYRLCPQAVQHPSREERQALD